MNENKPCDHRWKTSKRMFEPQTISRNSFNSCSALKCGDGWIVEALAMSAILIKFFCDQTDLDTIRLDTMDAMVT